MHRPSICAALALTCVGAAFALAQPLAVPGAAPAKPRPPQLADHDGLHHPFGVGVAVAPRASDPEPDRAVAPEGLPRDEPAVAVDPRDPRHVVVAMNDYNITNGARAALYSSQDGGRSFRGPTVWPLPQGVSVTGDPSLAADQHGRMFFSFAAYGDTGTRGAGGIYVARSSDGGRTWSRDLTRLSVDDLDISRGQCHFHDKDEVATDPRTGDVVVAWTDYDYDGSSNCGDGSIGDIAMVALSTDHGRHFRVAPVSEVTDFTVGAMPRVGRDGSVYVAYTTYGDFLACPPEVSTSVQIVVARLHGSHVTRAHATPHLCDPYEPSPTGGTYRTYSFPSLEVLPSGTLVLATVVQQEQQSALYVVRSDDRGRSWRSVATPTLSPVAQYHFPRLSTAPHGLALAYVEQLPGGLYSCMLSTSRDGGLTWSAPVTVATERTFGSNASFVPGFDGDYIGLAVGSDGVAHPAWTDIRTPTAFLTTENVWTRRVPLR